jgi:hypothetical protein
MLLLLAHTGSFICSYLIKSSARRDPPEVSKTGQNTHKTKKMRTRAPHKRNPHPVFRNIMVVLGAESVSDNKLPVSYCMNAILVLRVAEACHIAPRIIIGSLPVFVTSDPLPRFQSVCREVSRLLLTRIKSSRVTHMQSSRLPVQRMPAAEAR